MTSLAPHNRRRHLATIRVCSDMAAHAPAFPDYFVVMIDHGRGGREAVVDPEMTRREIVSRILTFEYDPEAILFIHHISASGVADVTVDIISECARVALGDPPDPPDPIDRQTAAWDHNRDERKHWRA